MIASRLVDARWLPIAALLILATLAPLLTDYPYLALVPALGLLALLVIGRHPELGLYMIIFLIPFGNFRNLSGPLENIKIHWLLALALLLIVTMRLLADRTFVTRFRSNLWPWLLGFLAASLLSTFFSDYQGHAAGQLVLTLVAILFFALTISLIDRRGITRHIPIVIAAAVSLSSLFAVLGNVLGIGWFSEGETFSRSTGGTADPNALAMQIIFGIPFLVFWLTHARHLWSRILALIMIVVNLAAMVGTFSRSGALVAGLALITLFAINAKGIRPRQLGLIIAGTTVAILVGIAMLPQSFWERQSSLLASEKDRALERRGSYIIVARDAFLQRPFLGHGPGTFRDLYALSDWAQLHHRKGSTKRRYAHNTYLEVLVGTGALGFFFFAGLLITALRNLLQARKRLIDRGDHYHAAQVLHYFIAFLFLLLYLTMFSDVFQKFMLLCLGLSQIWLRFVQEEDLIEATSERIPATSD